MDTLVNPLDLTGKRILVTGASSGIGRATAVLLSRLGAQVVLVARNADRLCETLAMLEGTSHASEVFDMTAYEQIPAWLRSVAGTYGAFDGAVHSAGMYSMSPLRTLEPNQVEELWRLNVFSQLWLAKGYRQNRVNNSGGSVVLISSAVGLIGQPGLSAYSASKGAIISLMRSLAIELSREKIRVNCIAPGNLKTSMTDVRGVTHSPEVIAASEKEHPLGFGLPEDVAYAAAYLLSSAARWVTGSTVVVDGGYTTH